MYILVECYALLASGSAHAKLEARITLRYVQCPSHVYRKTSPLTRLGELAPLANYTSVWYREGPPLGYTTSTFHTTVTLLRMHAEG